MSSDRPSGHFFGGGRSGLVCFGKHTLHERIPTGEGGAAPITLIQNWTPNTTRQRCEGATVLNDRQELARTVSVRGLWCWSGDDLDQFDVEG